MIILDGSRSVVRFSPPGAFSPSEMFRFFRSWLAEAAGGAKGGAGGGAAGGAGSTTTKKKRSKWIDRRYKFPVSERTKFPINAQPACALCHVRFRFKDDYLAHKQSQLHLARERWAETEKWWASVGEKAHHQRELDDQATYERVLAQRSAASGVGIEALGIRLRRAQVHFGPKHHAGVEEGAAGRLEIVEPRDNRWPSTPKW
jgi:hypothetical protein